MLTVERTRVRWWFAFAMVASSCHGFVACDPERPIENLPVKLWFCSTLDRRCEVFARFQSTIDCNTHQAFLHAACDPAAPPGEIHCYPGAPPLHRKRFFSKCSVEDLTFTDVHDGGTWIQ